jgi:hypothetical protein
MVTLDVEGRRLACLHCGGGGQIDRQLVTGIDPVEVFVGSRKRVVFHKSKYPFNKPVVYMVPTSVYPTTTSRSRL